MPVAARRMASTAAVACLYVAVAGALLWPLPRQLGSQSPGAFTPAEFDAWYATWALAWESHTFASGRFDLADANIYYPDRDALFYGPAALGALPYFAPVYLLSGNPALAMNLLLLGSIALTAAVIHLVVHAWTRLHAAGWVAAITFLANRWLLRSFV